MKTTRIELSSEGRPYRAVTRLTPRMSVNKLGAYTVATALGRESIVRDQKSPPSFKAARYERARQAITEYLTQDARDSSVILRAIERISAGSPRTSFAQQDMRLSIEALERFLQGLELIPVELVAARRGEKDQPVMVVEGVEISVRPEVIFRAVHRGKPTVGAIKLRFSKSDALDVEAAANVTTVIHEYAERFIGGEGEVVNPRHCLLLDVFENRWYEASGSFRSRRRAIAAACREIALRWASVDGPGSASTSS